MLAVLIALASLASNDPKTPDSSVRSAEAADPFGPQSLPPTLALEGKGTADVGDRIPAFSVATLDGARFEFPNGKPTAFFFTSSFCGSCIAKAQAFDRIERDVSDRVAILGVDIDPFDTESSFRSWIDAAGEPRYDFAMDGDGRLTTLFDVIALSTVVVTDGDGEVVYRSFAEGGEQALRAALEEAGL